MWGHNSPTSSPQQGPQAATPRGFPSFFNFSYLFFFSLSVLSLPCLSLISLFLFGPFYSCPPISLLLSRLFSFHLSSFVSLIILQRWASLLLSLQRWASLLLILQRLASLLLFYKGVHHYFKFD